MKWNSDKYRFSNTRIWYFWLFIYIILINRLGKSLSVCLISCIHFMLKNLATYIKILWLYDAWVIVTGEDCCWCIVDLVPSDLWLGPLYPVPGLFGSGRVDGHTTKLQTAPIPRHLLRIPTRSQHSSGSGTKTTMWAFSPRYNVYLTIILASSSNCNYSLYLIIKYDSPRQIYLLLKYSICSLEP